MESRDLQLELREIREKQADELNRHHNKMLELTSQIMKLQSTCDHDLEKGVCVTCGYNTHSKPWN